MAALEAGRKMTALGLLFLGALFLMMGVRQYYTWHMPEAAEIGSARSIAVQVNYGKTVFVTSIEQKILYATYVLVAVTAVTVIATYMVVGMGRQNGR